MVLYKPVNPDLLVGLISKTGYFNPEYQLEEEICQESNQEQETI